MFSLFFFYNFENLSFKDMFNLAEDFQNSVLQYGKIIISERYLPHSNKTIKPLDLGLLWN